MCKRVDGKELTLPQIIEKLEAKKHSRILAASTVVYSRQEVDSARIVLERLLSVIPTPGARDTTSIHHTSVRG